MRVLSLILLFICFFSLPAVSRAEPLVPDYINPSERIGSADLTGRGRIRFLTTVDFPPFNFLDQSQRLAGFNVDLARAICAELKVLDRCQLQALPWPELETALTSWQGEAVIAGTAMTAQSKEKYLFTRPYLELPARFITLRNAAINGETAASLTDRRVGVLTGSAHEAMLRAWFPKVRVVTFSRHEWAFDALRKGNIDALFGDGVRLSFWLQSQAAEKCCRFFDGPYISPAFLGEGLAIAVAPDNEALVAAFNHALSVLSRNGRFAELYLRWFPEGLY